MNLSRSAHLPCFVVLICGFATALVACGGGAGGGTTPQNPTLTTPSVTVTPASSGVTTAESLSAAVKVSGNGPTPTGSVVLSSGSYASSALTLIGGRAVISIPAGLLAVGADTLTAKYTPDTASAATYNSASGTVSVTVASTSGLPTVNTSSLTYSTVAPPFQAVVASNGTVFVSVSGQGVQVFIPTSSGLTSQCVNQFPPSLSGEGASATNLSFLPNGTTVAVGVGAPGAIFYSTSALGTCTATGLLVSQGTIASDQGTLEADATPDGKYAFVSNEYGVAAGATTEGNIGVVQMQYDFNGNVTTGTTLLGQISTGGRAIAGMLLSPDGTRLYVTSEIAGTTAGAGSGNPVLAENNCVQAVGGTPQLNGILTVIDVAKAERSPSSSAIISTVDAGCSPVRMAETADESTLWVSARGDNRVLAFSTGMLESNPGSALLGYADTGGTAPVGIKLFHKDQLLAVANSNRFGAGPTANATILDVSTPATASVVATIPTGLFPREFWVGADDATLYLTNYDSDTLQVVSTTVQ